jgi:hypothetical protein
MPCPTLTDRLDRDYPGLEVRRDNDLFEADVRVRSGLTLSQF